MINVINLYLWPRHNYNCQVLCGPTVEINDTKDLPLPLGETSFTADILFMG